jgi:acyl-CoA synthetase (AMP-forming)/AMP-acid ligase II
VRVALPLGDELRVADVIRRVAAGRGDVVAVRHGARALTYGELDERSNRLARALVESGAGPGVRVAYLDRSAPEVIELLFAASKIGAVLVPLNWRLAVAELARIVADARAPVLVAGGAFAETAAALRTFRCDLFGIYGLTETTGAAVQLDADDHDPGGPREHLLRAAGRPYPWVDLRIVDPATGADRAQGEVGEVWLRAPNVMAGYFERPAETAAALTADGWLRTGDGGYVDAEGYLFVTDRIKDMIVSGGENVYPVEVEEALAQHPDVDEVAVIGVPDERWGETVKALVVPRAGAAADADELVAFARTRLAGYKLPRSIEFVGALPRTPSGKVLKRELRERFGAGPARAVP